MTEKEKEFVKSAIARYSDLSYDLSGLVTEVIPEKFSILMS